MLFGYKEPEIIIETDGFHETGVAAVLVKSKEAMNGDCAVLWGFLAHLPEGIQRVDLNPSESPNSKFLTFCITRTFWFDVSFNFPQDIVVLFFLRRFHPVC